MDTLHVLYNRTRLSKEEFKALVRPMFMHDTIDLLQKLYDWSCVDPNDIDEEKYLLLKKLSEVIHSSYNL